MNKFFLVAIILIIIAAGVGFYMSGLPEERSDEQTDTTNQEEDQTEDQPNVPENWQTYESEEFDFTFAYPPEADVTIENEQVKVTYLGPDNTMGSEITDGFTLFINTALLADGESLEEMAEAEYEDEKDQFDEISSVEESELGDREGYEYTFVSELGPDITRVFLEADDKEEVIQLSHMVIDPNNEGYSDLMEEIVRTISLNGEQIVSAGADTAGPFSFQCPGGDKLEVTYGDDADTAELLVDGESYSLERAMSASGARYASDDSSVVFWERQGEAQVEIDGEIAYEECELA